MDTCKNFLKKIRALRRDRRARRAVRAVDKAANTVSAVAGTIMGAALKLIVTVLLIVITTGLLFTCIFAVYAKTCLNDTLDFSLEEASLDLTSTIWVQNEYGEWEELTKLYDEENREWVDYENIPIYLEWAAVSIEDQRFYEHKGVDWYRTFGAFANMFLSMSNTFGGSTITQQLIKNITHYDDVTVQRKLTEIFSALDFEKLYTKQEIMTWYLNEIYLGEGCYGVQSASRNYFDKNVWELDLAECACIIGITNNPSLYDPYFYPENNKYRQEVILYQMYDQGYISYEEYEQAAAEELVFAYGGDYSYNFTPNSWYVDQVINDVLADLQTTKGISSQAANHLLFCGGYNIYCCMDKNIQSIADYYYQNTDLLPQSYYTSSQQLQSAIVIEDPYTGDIVAIEGGVGEKTQSRLLSRATQAYRPPGSSFKPLSVYAPAIDLGLISLYTDILDSNTVTLSGTDWLPANDKGTYLGYTNILQGIVYSKNTVAAQVLDKLGLQTSYSYLTDHFGITSLIVSDGEGHTDIAYAPLALGQLSYGITVREMAQAYTAFVNDGVMSYGRTYYLVTDHDNNTVMENPTQQIVAIKANTAWNIDYALQQVVSSGTGTDAYFGTTAVAGKTGTTSDDYDRWFVGFTKYYVAAVWTGYDYNECMYFYNNPAAAIFKMVMADVHAGYEYASFTTPTISGDTGLFSSSFPVTTYYYEDETDETDDTGGDTTDDGGEAQDDGGGDTPVDPG